MLLAPNALAAHFQRFKGPGRFFADIVCFLLNPPRLRCSGVSEHEERETFNVARASMRSPQGDRGSLRSHRKNNAPAQVLDGLGPETGTAPARQGHVRATSGPRQRPPKRERVATFGA